MFVIQIANAEKKEWHNNLEGVVTRCFKTQAINVSCDEYPDDKPKPPLKDINLTAKDLNEVTFSYFYGRAIPAEMCNRHIARIKKLLIGAKQACITGDVEFEVSHEHETNRNKEFSLHWLAFETAAGEVHRNFD